MHLWLRIGEKQMHLNFMTPLTSCADVNCRFPPGGWPRSVYKFESVHTVFPFLLSLVG